MAQGFRGSPNPRFQKDTKPMRQTLTSGKNTVRPLTDREKAMAECLANIIETAVFTDDGIVDAFLRNMHAQTEHSDAIDNRRKPLNRLLEWPAKRGDAVFTASKESPDPMRDAVERMLLDNSGRIAKWLLFSPDKDLCLSFDKDNIPLDQKIGVGVARVRNWATGKEQFVERDCYDAVMVVTKSTDHRAYSLWNLDTGIAMKTIYPDVQGPDAKNTGRDLMPDLLECYAYRRCTSPVQKKEWADACAKPDIADKAQAKAETAPKASVKQTASPTARILIDAEFIRLAADRQKTESREF